MECDRGREETRTENGPPIYIEPGLSWRSFWKSPWRKKITKARAQGSHRGYHLMSSLESVHETRYRLESGRLCDAKSIDTCLAGGRNRFLPSRRHGVGGARDALGSYRKLLHLDNRFGMCTWRLRWTITRIPNPTGCKKWGKDSGFGMRPLTIDHRLQPLLLRSAD